MRDENDWRLKGQLKYFKGAELAWRAYRAPRPDWDHDHCEFCRAEFAEREGSDVLHAGYATPDEYRWVCLQCFEDFKDLFGWRITDAAPIPDVSPN